MWSRCAQVSWQPEIPWTTGLSACQLWKVQPQLAESVHVFSAEPPALGGGVLRSMAVQKSLETYGEVIFQVTEKLEKKLTHPHIRWKTWLQISSNHYPVTLVATFSEYYLREFALAALSHRFKDSCMGVKIYPRRAISRLNSGFRGTYLFQTTYGVKVRSFRSMWKIAGQGCHGYGLAWFS